MRISAINFTTSVKQKLNISPKFNLDYKIQDTVSFGRKVTLEPSINHDRANYPDMLSGLDLTRQRTIPQLREAYKAGEDISEDREKLILSRIPKILKDAKDFTKEHPEFDVEDVEQELIKIAVKTTDSELTTTSDYRTYGPIFETRKREYFEKILGRQNKKDTMLPQAERFLLIEQEELAPEEVHTRMEQAISNGELREDLGEAIKRLKPRYQEIIRMRYGLDGNKPMTLKAIGKSFSTTGENIRQTEEKALKSLKKAYINVVYENMVQGKYDEY